MWGTLEPTSSDMLNLLTEKRFPLPCEASAPMMTENGFSYRNHSRNRREIELACLSHYGCHGGIVSEEQQYARSHGLADLAVSTKMPKPA